MRQAVQVLGKGEELLQHGAGDVHAGGLAEGGTHNSTVEGQKKGQKQKNNRSWKSDGDDDFLDDDISPPLSHR